MHLIHDMEIYKKYEKSKYFGLIFGTISMIFYLAGMILFSKVYNPSLSDEYYFKCSVYWTIFLFTFIIGGSNYFTDLFKLKLFQYGGKFSFGIYLYHMGIIKFFFMHLKKTVKLQFEIVLYSFFCSFVVGFLHYYLIEKQLIKLANKFCFFIGNIKLFKRDNFY